MGGGANANFTTAGNWSPSPPPNDGTAGIIFSGTMAPGPIVDTAFSINALTYASGVASFTLSNSGGAGLTIQSSLQHNSSNPVFISAPLTLGSTFTFSGFGGQAFLGLSGGLTATNGFTAANGMYLEIKGGTWNVGGTVTVQGASILEFQNSAYTLGNNFVNNGGLNFNAGANLITVNGAISGGGTVFYGSPTTLNASNTYTGTSTVGAMVTLGTTNALPTGGTVNFISPSGVLKVDNNQTVGGLNSAAGNGTATIASTKTLTISGTTNPVFSGTIEGAGALVKSGSGTQTFTGSVSPVAGTTISAGAVQIGNGTTSGSLSGDVVVGSGASLIFNGDTSSTYAGIASGGGTLSKLGFGTLTLSGANTYTGATSVNGGTLSISNATGLGTTSLGTTVASGATLDINGVAVGSENLTLNGMGVSNTGALTGTGIASHAGNITLASNAALGGTGTLTLSGVISQSGGTQSLSKVGTGTLILSGGIIYGGSTSVNAGTLRLGASGVLSSSSLVILSPLSGNTATLDLANTTQTVGGLNFGGAPTTSSNVTLGASGVLTLASSVNYNATDSPGNGSITGGTLALGGNRNFVIDDSSNASSELLVSSAITGAGFSLSKSGAGTLTLAGLNTYTGGTIVFDGRLVLAANNALPSGGNVTLNQEVAGRTATLDLGANSQTIGALTFGGNGAAGGSSGAMNQVMLSGGGTLTLGGNVTYDATNSPGMASIFGGTLSLGGATRTFTVANSSAAGTDLSISAAITGTGGLIKTGAGSMFMNGSNTFTGSVTINEGSLMAQGGALPAGVMVLLAPVTSGRTAALDVSGTSAAIGGLTLGGVASTNTNVFISSESTLNLAGNITYDATNNPNFGSISGGLLQLTGVRTIDVGNSTAAQTDLSINSAIGGSGGIIKTGAGTLLLGGASSYTGDTTISTGTVILTHPNALGATAAGTVVASGATLNLSQVSVGSEALTLSGTGASGLGALISSGSASWAGQITLAGNTAIGPQGSTGTALQLSGPIVESGGVRSLTKLNFGTLTLLGNNTYSGGTFIAQGTLRASGTGSLPVGRDVTVNGTTGGPTTLDLFSSTQSIGNLTLGGPGASAFGMSQVLIGSGGTLTLAGNITFDATNNPQGAMIMASNQYEYSPFGGNLALGNVTRTFNVGDSTNSNASSDLTILANISGESTTTGILKTGAGTLLLGGASTFAGGVDLTSGTLLLGSSTNSDGSTLYSGPVGTGMLTMRGGTTLGAGGVFTMGGGNFDDRTLANNVQLYNNVTLGASGQSGGRELTLSGVVTVMDPATTLHLGGGDGLIIEGTLRAATTATTGTAITFDSGGATQPGFVALLGPVEGTTVGSSNRIASLTANNAAIVFGTAAIPTAGTSTMAVSSINNGYIGLVAPGRANDLLALISATDRTNYSGVFGFDSNYEVYPGNPPNQFTENLDFSGFGPNFTIGSLSAAILSGTLTPASNGYAFGNGGGLLMVRSDLGGAFGVKVGSVPSIPENALTVVFQGNNTFTGPLTVTNSVGILDSAYALPAGGTFNLETNGYLGYTERFSSGVAYAPVSFATFVSRLGTYTPTSVLGLDSYGYVQNFFTEDYSSYATRQIYEPIDLRALNAIYLGTATRTVIHGTVQAPTGGTLSLIGVKDGHLTINSPLRAGNVSSLVVGSSSSVLGEGTVMLSGRNTYAGGTTLLSGLLLADGSSELNAGGNIVAGPLGTGTLTVGSGALRPTLASSMYDDTVIHNNIVLQSRLQLGMFDPYYGGGGAAFSAQGYYGYAELFLNGIISGVGGLDIFTDTTLNGGNTFTGGVNLYQGILTLGRDLALGTGPLTIAPNNNTYIGLSLAGGSHTIANNIVFNNFNNNSIAISGRGSLTVNGNVSLNSSVQFNLGAYPMYINGAVSGGGRLSVYGENALVLGGTNTYFGGTRADQGAIVFSTSGSLPAQGPLSTNYGGYIGTAFNYGANLQSNFINRFDRNNSQGAIGFDSPAGAPQTFTGNIDLRGFSTSVRLGSASSAILSGTITPQDSHNYYNFGGGGGLLDVRTALTGAARGLKVVSSWYDPLTLRINPTVPGSNTFNGGTYVENSAVIFTGAGLPVGTNDFSLSSGAYIGLELGASVNGSDATVQNFLGHFPNYLGGFLGFDGGITITDLNLSRFSSNSLALATTSSFTLAGNLTLIQSATNYAFAGYKGGQLTIASGLNNGVDEASNVIVRTVTIGNENVPATFGTPTTPDNPFSSVTLSGANTYTGGTTLLAGVLRLGHNSALGTGPLTVPSLAAKDEYVFPSLFAAGGSRTIANPLNVNSSLNIGGDFNLALTGNVSGSGELYKVGASTLTLSGANGLFSGGIYVAQGNLTLASATAAGTGPIRMGTTASPSVTFLVSMLVNGISGDNAVDQINLGADTVLTVNQTFDAQYLGRINSVSGSAAVVYQGPSISSPSRLRLAGSNSYNGSTTINPGITLTAGHNEVFGPGNIAANAVSLNGGALAVETGVTISNPLTLNSGVLGGLGTLQPTATLNVGGTASARTVIAPGFGTTGTLNFSNATLGATPVLTLSNGGFYNWQLLDAMTAGGWDVLNVTGTVHINSFDSANLFTLRITPTGGLDLLSTLVNFNPNQLYSWNVINATAITGFGGSQIAVDATSMGGLLNGGFFSFSLNGAGTSLLLNFTPAVIPEPSTYALLGLGVLAVFYTVRRRRR